MGVDVLTEVGRIISSIGFPIVCTYFLWKKIDEDNKQKNQIINRLLNEVIKREENTPMKEGEEND